uniref:Serine/threonine-protein kinase Nek11 n=1 Tax=Naja naja TaxID=35670 RepID=A0A8C6Y2A0_NAJNA
MLKFQEAVKHGTSFIPISIHSKTLIAGRYNIYQKLGRGSFGTVYLVSDKKAKEEQLKVLKEISVGNLKPNETVEANLEAQLLSRLDHPAIVKFYSSFVEGGSFCIITEYCEGQDLDFKIQEYKRSGKGFPESQIVEWFIQLLLGVNYLHERRILHRDLKAKNIFLKNNLVKIGTAWGRKSTGWWWWEGAEWASLCSSSSSEPQNGRSVIVVSFLVLLGALLC